MTLAELCVKRAVFAVMLIAFLVVLGIFSFRDLGVDLFPRADPATVNISVSLPGATPEEITTQVVLPMEEALSTISGMDEVTSQVQAGRARINCQFVLERDIESAAQDVREKVAGALRDLPPNILPPIIQKADPDSDPVLSVVVAGDREPARDHRDRGQEDQARPGDGGRGGRGLASPAPACARSASSWTRTSCPPTGSRSSTSSRRSRRRTSRCPGGTISRGDAELGVRTLGRLDAVSQFGEIIVRNVGGHAHPRERPRPRRGQLRGAAHLEHARGQAGGHPRDPPPVRHQHRQDHRHHQGEAGPDRQDPAPGRGHAHHSRPVRLHQRARSRRSRSTSSSGACSRP